MLRTRIFLNLIPFILILVGVAVYVLYLFGRLANTVDQTIAANYHSDAATVEMMLAVERMDAALDRSRKEDKNSAQLMFDTNRRIFADKLQWHFTNAAPVARISGVFQIQTNFIELRNLARDMFATNLTRAEMDAKYNDSIFLTDNLKRSLTAVREEIRENIFATGQKIQQINRTTTSLLILGLVIALLISTYASIKLTKAILDPIRILTNAAREIGQGNLDQTVPVLSQDELGELAMTFNRMAGQLNTYRRSTTEQIIRLHRTMEAALASFSDPVFIVDRLGRVELSNRAAEQLNAQLERDGTLPPKLATAAASVLERNEDFLPDSFDEVITLRLKGEERSFLPRLHIMREADANPVGVAIVLHDVTRFRLLDDAKTNLVATVSHELKTPLTSVRMVLHLLLERSLGELNAKQAKLLETARKDSERLLRMLDALLDIARLEAGAAPVAKERVSPAQLVESIRAEVEANVTAHQMKLVCEVAPALPDVLVDRQQISPVFHNFISNAIKHSPAGGTIQISATVAGEGDVQFSVRDAGPGIDPKHQSMIFDRFYRVPGQTKRGVGLGLSIAREIVVAHGGRVGVRSEPGHGSEFFFVLSGADKQEKRKNGSAEI